jgi:hypothetical protein
LPTSGSKEDLTLAEDIPDHGLQAGDLGTMVEVYAGGGVEVEFVTGSGATQADNSLYLRFFHVVNTSEPLCLAASPHGVSPIQL